MSIEDVAEPAGTVFIGLFRGVAIEAAAWDAAEATVDLMVAVMFAREMRGAKLSGGVLRLDEALGGALRALRKDRIFSGDVGETLTLSSPPGPIRADALLLIGSGRPEQWTLDVARTVAAAALREALVRGVASAAFAPGLIDSGLSRKAVAGAPAAMMQGVLSTLEYEAATDGSTDAPFVLRRWIFEKGPGSIEDAVTTFKHAFEARH